MNQPDETVYLHHIRDAINRVDRFLQGVDKDTFLTDELLQSAVVYQVQTVGEAVRRLSPAFRKSHTRIPWHQIAGMRSKLVHDYFGIELEAVWLAATHDLPELDAEISRILGEGPQTRDE